MSNKQIREGARTYALKKAAKSFVGDLPILPAQLALGAGVGAVTGGMGAKMGLGIAAAGHLALSGKEAVKSYKREKNFYNAAKREGIKIKEDIENIIQGSLEGDAVLIKNSLNNVLGMKIAEKVEAMKAETASNMFDAGRPKSDDEVEEELPEIEDEDEFEDEEDFEYDDSELEDNENLETDK